MNDANDRQEREIAERARKLFAESVDGLDGETRSRLARARARAVAAARPRRSAWLAPPRLVPLGGLAAAALVAALVWQRPEPAVEPVEEAVLSDLDLLLGGEEIELFEDLEFYAWLLEQPELLQSGAGEDGSG
jgi:hypothetical protein